MAIKIVLEKAYDRLKWDFISDTLEDAKLPNDMVRIIMQCVSTSMMQILWNGGVTEEFKPTRGIRQGDLISPYLFMLTMERLGHAIKLAVADGRWKPIVLGRGCPPLSHLFFADDLVLFGEASIDNVIAMRSVLEQFLDTKLMLVSHIYAFRTTRLQSRSDRLGIS